MFKVGDLVELKSGGPVMTVQEVPRVVPMFGFKITTYTCSWFVESKLQSGEFHSGMLNAANV